MNARVIQNGNSEVLGGPLLTSTCQKLAEYRHYSILVPQATLKLEFQKLMTYKYNEIRQPWGRVGWFQETERVKTLFFSPL